MPRKKNNRKQKQLQRRAADTDEQKKQSPRRVAMVARQAYRSGAEMALAAMVGGISRINQEAPSRGSVIPQASSPRAAAPPKPLR